MRTCPTCNLEIEPGALTEGTCPHCGGILRKVAHRTIDDKGLLADDPSATTESIGATFNLELEDLGLEDPIESENTDTDRVDLTLEAESPSEGKDPSLDTNVPVEPDDYSELEKKLPTVADQSDMTMDLGWMLSQGESQDASKPSEDSSRASDDPSQTPEDSSKTSDQFPSPEEPPKKANRRSTHTLESDRTVDLSAATSDELKLGSQWGGTFEAGTKQSQTIRQKETVTGFRSSLPVKSRYVRERRKSPAQPPKTLAEVPDYELLDIIGEGGMGVVYAAHQSSIARTVAVKMLKPSAKVREDQRDKFISEAVVTGELDHPNIVPIYDLGSNEQGALFYSMKRVRGTPWDKVIDQKQLDENLSILLRVADAVAFAHAGGVIHRDLKPENVMLGDYGEVLVMDWGLARITPEFAHKDSVYQADSLGGTPAYMAPEMARGPVENINKTSDIYLLGAILYEIIGGQPPHSGRDVMQCLMAASQNKIDPIRYEGELKAIALKAMATRQEDRYQTVKEFQEAIRTYQSHSESLVLTAHANQNLQKARAANDRKEKYQLFARALYGFQESLTLWDGNHRARTLLKETQFDYATCALNNGDLDLAGTLLDTSHEDHQALLTKIEAAHKERDARQRRLKMAKMAVAALAAGIILTTSVGLYLVNAQRNKAIAARQEAERQRGIAEVNEKEAVKQKGIAVTNAQEALTQKGFAEKNAQEALTQKGIAEKNAQEALTQKGIAEQNAQEALTQKGIAETNEKEAAYEAYIAQIGLASAKIEENAFEFAKLLLESKEAKPELRNWEWGRLYHLCNLKMGEYKSNGVVDAVAYSPDGKSFAMGDRGGKLAVIDLETGQKRFEVSHGQLVLSVAYSRDGKLLASGSSNNSIKIINATTGRELKTLVGIKLEEDTANLNKKAPDPKTLAGHTDGVLTVRFSPDGKQLLSGSLDKTARLWDIDSGNTLQTFQGHSWWVWAAEFSPDGRRLVTAGQDGKAIVWEKRGAASVQQNDNVASTRRAVSNASPASVRLAVAQVAQSGARSQRAPVNEPGAIYEQFTEFTHKGAIYTARFSPRGDLIASGGHDEFVMVWNPDKVRRIDLQAVLDNESQPQQEALRFTGHDGPVRCVAFSANGRLLLSGSEDNSLRVWEVASGKELKRLRGHNSDIHSCTFSPDGKYILAGDDDRVCRWDLAKYEEVRMLPSTVFAGHEDAVLSARFSRDGQRIVLASRDRTASLSDAASGELLRRFQEGHDFLISTAEYSSDGNYIATGAGDNTVRVWDAKAGTELAAFGFTGRIGTLAISPDNRWIATGSSPKNPWIAENVGTEVQIWAAPSAQDQVKPGAIKSNAVEKLVARLTGHEAVVSALDFAPNGDWLASGDDMGGVRLWKRNNNGWTFAHDLRGHSRGMTITAVRFTPDSRRLITASGDRTCAQWDVASGQELKQLSLKHPAWVSSLDVSANGELAVTTSDDGMARLWRLTNATVIAQVRSVVAGKKAEEQNPFNFASFSPDNKRAVLTSAGNQLVSVWDISAATVAANQQAMVQPALDLSQSDSEVWAASFAPDGQHVLMIGGNDAQLWKIDPPSPMKRFSPHGSVASANISPDGTLIATGSWDRSAKIWDVATGKSNLKLDRIHNGYINSVEFSPDGAELLTASEDSTARLWDVATGKPLGDPLKGHTKGLNAATFSPNANRILTVSADKTARIWDHAGGESKRTLTGHKMPVLCGRFSSDGKHIITGSQDKSAIIWDAKSGQQILILKGHTAAINSVALSKDGTRAITGSQDNTAKLWDAKTGKEILTLPGHTQEVTSVSFSPDGRNVLTSSRDGTAIIWLASDWRGQQPNVAASDQR